MDPAGTGEATPLPRWEAILSLLLAGVTIAVYFRFSTRVAPPRPASTPHLHHPPEATTKLSNAAAELAKSGITAEEPSSQQGTQGGVRLVEVYPKDMTETDIDIIAIHGLDTKSPNTWSWVDRRNTKKSINWLQDPSMLPARVKGARIFTCDWPADLWQPSNRIQKTLDELALLLLDGIQRRPPATGRYGREDRPILFIASCVGGLVLMKALVSAGEGPSSIRKTTRGILFLATPFRGTSLHDVATWAERRLKAQALIQGREVNKLLDIIKGSTSTEALVSEFTDLARHKEPPWLLFNFYELGNTSLPRKVFPWLPDFLADNKRVGTAKISPLTPLEFYSFILFLSVTSSGLLTLNSWSISRRRLST